MSAEAESAGPLLRDFASWAGSLRDFESWLGDSGLMGMDVDFMCERNGSFLILEGKPYFKGCRVSWGQHKALKALAAIPQFTVYLVGEKDEKFHVMPYSDARPDYHRPNAVWAAKYFLPTNKDGLRTLVQEWWDDNG